MKNERIAITSDSTTDLGKELLERYHISVLPLGIALGTELYTDGVDISPDFIYEHHSKTGELPKTNATNLAECIEFFRPFCDAGKSVIHFTISSEMSSTYSNAVLAAQEFENVYVIDTKNLSSGGGLLVLAAAQMAEDGMEASEIAQRVNELAPCVDASFIIDSLEYLYKGGRCSALAALGANLLKLKPCIQVKDGKMGVSKKYRGKFGDVLKEYVRDKIEDYSDIITDNVFVTHAGCDDEIVDAVVELVKSLVPFENLYVTRAGCTISSHCGRNTLGVLFIRKSPLK